MNENFQMSEDLLRSVIFDQAGSILKAIEECLQNSLDAGATMMSLKLNNKGFTFCDNGCGMNEEDIISHFKVFGNSTKRNDKTKIGKFGMGRGQIFAFGFTKWITRKSEMRVNLKRRLGYHMKKLKSEYSGTKIICSFYKPIDNYELDRTLYGIREYYLSSNNVIFLINDEKLEIKKEILFEDDEFELFSCNNYSRRVFSQNLYVKDLDTVIDYNINCKIKMELNFARNSFLEDKDSTKRLYKTVNSIEREKLLSVRSFDASQGKYILKSIAEGKFDCNEFMNKKIVEMADGSKLSLSDIKGKTIMFGEKNRASDKAIQRGYVVIDSGLKTRLEKIKEKVNFTIDRKCPEDVVDESEYKEIEEQEVLDRIGERKFAYYSIIKSLNNIVFENYRRELKVGETDTAEAWTDGSSVITLNIRVLNRSMKKFPKLMSIYHILCHEYAHEYDDKNETDHDSNFYKRYYNIIERTNFKLGTFLHKSRVLETEREIKREQNK